MSTEIGQTRLVGFMPNSVVIAAVTCGLLYAFYLCLLPKPIPGIPYSEKSAKRILGHLPEFAALEGKGHSPRIMWPQSAAEANSPITQFFPGPFAKTGVCITDFREAQDLMLRRGKELGRGSLNRHAWTGLIPEHFIGMEDFDHRFKDTKGLSKDLMTSSFLNTVNAPASHQKVLNFVKLWTFKMEKAHGCTFEVGKDLGSLTFDIITAAAVNLDDKDSEIVQYQQTLRSADLSSSSPLEKDALFKFPEIKTVEMHQALHTLNKAAAAVFLQPSQRLFHLINNCMPSMKKAYRSKRTILQRYIDQSVNRLEKEGTEFEPKSAVDHMVSREASMAKKAGRAPVYDSLRLNDNLFGYITGGQDSTHSTLSFMVKHLGEEQEVQAKLRQLLREAYPASLAQGEQPTAHEIVTTQVPYLDGFIEEVLRLSNPSQAVTKEALNDMEILGYAIPKGTTIVFATTGPSYSQHGMPVNEDKRSMSSQKHRSDGFGDWAQSDFPAEQFQPERWLKPSDDKDGGMVFNARAGPILTFSSGTRACWGKRLAYLELKLVTTLLIWNFVFEKIPERHHNWDIENHLFIKPRDCRVRLRSAW